MTKKILALFIVITATIVVVIISCKHDTTPPIIDPNSIPPGICFTDDVLPILQSNCAFSGCHAGSQNPNLSNYASIIKQVKPGDPENSRLYTTAIGNSMPPRPKSPLNLQEVTLIYGWILQGATDSTCACDTTLYTFNSIIFPIIQKNCLGCHNTGSANGELTDYAQISAKANTIYNNVSGAGTQMPPAPANPLSECKITQIKEWINSGTPNN